MYIWGLDDWRDMADNGNGLNALPNFVLGNGG
jgi:hypothetical protein